MTIKRETPENQAFIDRMFDCKRLAESLVKRLQAHGGTREEIADIWALKASTDLEGLQKAEKILNQNIETKAQTRKAEIERDRPLTDAEWARRMVEIRRNKKR